MNATRAFFMEEATECLEAARSALERDDPDPAALHRAIRRLRGAAQVSRMTGIASTATSLEERLRSATASAGGLSADLGAAAARSLGRLESALERVRSGETEPENRGDGQMDGEVEGGVDIEELEYRGQAALERAMQLRPAIEGATSTDAALAPLLAELFDLIRLGMK